LGAERYRPDVSKSSDRLDGRQHAGLGDEALGRHVVKSGCPDERSTATVSADGRQAASTAARTSLKPLEPSLSQLSARRFQRSRSRVTAGACAGDSRRGMD